MRRRTKIVATLGPATDDPEVLDDLIAAGVDVVRLNASHGTHEDHRRRAQMVRDRARAAGRQVGVLVDLQGPKIRIGRFVDGSVHLRPGECFALDTAHPLDAGTADRVGVTYPTLHEEVAIGDLLLLDDGQIELVVEGLEETAIVGRIQIGGRLSDSKGINKHGGGLAAPALTDKDCDDIRFAASFDADYVAVSFVRAADDVHRARQLLRGAGGQGGIVAKIERAEVLGCVDEVIEAADVIMIARGDLGVEIGDAELPAVQKELTRKARSMNRVVITATQMMQSMIENPIPTRAEVFDVANAVIDGTDAVMLSAETATGKYPVKVVAAMARICKESEKQQAIRRSSHRIDSVFVHINEAVAMAAMYTANHLGVAAIAALTETGATVQWMSRISSGIPIYALTPHVATRRRVTLYRGVYPVAFDTKGLDSAQATIGIIDELLRRQAVRDDDLIIITKGDLSGVSGGTNGMKIVRVGEHFESE